MGFLLTQNNYTTMVSSSCLKSKQSHPSSKKRRVALELERPSRRRSRCLQEKCSIGVVPKANLTTFGSVRGLWQWVQRGLMYQPRRALLQLHESSKRKCIALLKLG